MQACMLLHADVIAVLLKNHVVFLYFFYLIDERKNVWSVEFESAEEYTRHCRTYMCLFPLDISTRLLHVNLETCL